MARKDETVQSIPAMDKAHAWLQADTSRTVKEACQKFNLNYGTFWLRNRRLELKAEGHTFGEPTKAAIVKLRDAKNSWGEIAARFGDWDALPLGVSESKIRRMYTEATGIAHEGTRIGHGGRWLGGAEYHEILYRGENPKGEDAMAAGTQRAAGDALENLVATIAAERDAKQKLSRATPDNKAKAQKELATASAAVKVARQKHTQAAAATPEPEAKPKPVRKARKVSAKKVAA